MTPKISKMLVQAQNSIIEQADKLPWFDVYQEPEWVPVLVCDKPLIIQLCDIERDTLKLLPMATITHDGITFEHGIELQHGIGPE